jgi:hypothetical protein
MWLPVMMGAGVVAAGAAHEDVADLVDGDAQAGFARPAHDQVTALAVELGEGQAAHAALVGAADARQRQAVPQALAGGSAAVVNEKKTKKRCQKRSSWESRRDEAKREKAWGAALRLVSRPRAQGLGQCPGMGSRGKTAAPRAGREEAEVRAGHAGAVAPRPGRAQRHKHRAAVHARLEQQVAGLGGVQAHAVNTPRSQGSCGVSLMTICAAPVSNHTVRPMWQRWPV